MEFQRSLKLHIYICVPRSYYIIMIMMVMMVMMMNDKRISRALFYHVIYLHVTRLFPFTLSISYEFVNQQPDVIQYRSVVDGMVILCSQWFASLPIILTYLYEYLLLT